MKQPPLHLNIRNQLLDLLLRSSATNSNIKTAPPITHTTGLAYQLLPLFTFKSISTFLSCAIARAEVKIDINVSSIATEVFLIEFMILDLDDDLAYTKLMQNTQ